MKLTHFFQWIFVAILLTACGKHESSVSEKDELIGINFKSGKGLRISENTKMIIGLQLVEASEHKMRAEFTETVEVYQHRDSFDSTKLDGPNAYATGYVTTEQAKGLDPGQSIALRSSTEPDLQLPGKVVRVNSATNSALHMTEVIVEFPDLEKQFKIGTTIDATFTAKNDQTVTAIPRSAVLKTSAGIFAYVVNGDYFFRTEIKTGSESQDFIEIKDGLYAGDQIVKQPVMTLWIAELQAIKGGADND